MKIIIFLEVWNENIQGNRYTRVLTQAGSSHGYMRKVCFNYYFGEYFAWTFSESEICLPLA